MTTRSLKSALQSGWRIYRDQGLKQAARSGAYYAYETALRGYCALFSDESKRENIYEDEWDILLILDACRIDLLREVQTEYSFLEEIDSRWSVGSTSAEWMENTFVPEFEAEINNTIYLTGNPFSDSVISEDEFAEVIELWRTDWDEEAGTVRPSPLTDQAIARWRESSENRLIVHYMQPHYPFLNSRLTTSGIAMENWGDVGEENVWELLRDGKLETEEVWESYRENLRLVLDDVALLLESIDAETVVITADHGNGIGENGVYGHPRGICLPSLRRVPWVVTSAEKIRDYEPTRTEKSDQEETTDAEITDRLEALGYK